MSNVIKVISTRQLQELLKNPSYKEYYERKLLIQQKYPEIKKMDNNTFKEYLKEIGDLMWEINGPFEQFIRDNKSEWDKQIEERRARGGRKKYTRVEEEEDDEENI